MLQQPNQMDREHPARPFPQAQNLVATGHWTAQRLLRPFRKHRPTLQHAGYKPAVHGARIANPPVAACAKGGSTIRAPFGFSQHQ
jgi:hypothetical protein